MADLLITVPDVAVPRIKTAVGKAEGFGRDATTSEVQAFIRKELKEAVVRYERDRLAALPQQDARVTVEAEFA